MKFHVLTLFPEMVERGLAAGVIGRAAEKKIIAVDAVNIRGYTADRHGKVDDTPYGGGAGMLMQAQPVFDAHQAVCGGRKVRTVYVTPQGRPFDQKMAREFAGEEELILLCGHYEGIDERALEEVATDYVSIGDYVLTGGELAAMVIIDAVARLVPGVLGNEGSAEEESFSNDLLEYPQYSRPEVWRGKSVPQVLLSGNHSAIRKWRLEQAIERTRRNRPDLYRRYEIRRRLVGALSKDKRNNIHIMECLSRGQGEILYAAGEEVAVLHRESGVCMVKASSPEDGRRLLDACPEDVKWYVASRSFFEQLLMERGYSTVLKCSQFLYTRKEPLPVKHKEIRRLGMEDLAYIVLHYDLGSPSYVRGRLRAGAVYGAYAQGRLAGFIGMHDEGGMGMLYVEEACRRRGIAASLEAYLVNRMLERGWTPYGHVVSGNEASVRLQEKLGLYRAKEPLFWLGKPEKA